VGPALIGRAHASPILRGDTKDRSDPGHKNFLEGFEEKPETSRKAAAAKGARIEKP
jgi:hypothetical protein